jgi:hypothetical protein
MKSLCCELFTTAPARMAGAFLLIGMIGFATGCGEQIEVYQAPKEKVAASSAHPAGPPAGEAPPMPTIKWDEIPDGWSEGEGGTMRVATFSIAGKDGGKAGEMAVLPIPANAGLKELDLVSMWRQQLGLKAASEEELAKLTKPLEAGGATGKLYDISAGSAAGDSRILVGAVPDKGWMWFFKFTGTAEVVDQERESFTGFLKGIEFVPPQPRSRPASPPRTSVGRPDWKTPAHWEDLGAGMMQLAKFKADGEGGATEISVSRLGGAAGGIPPNVNRWRGQLGLGSVSNAEADASAKPFVVPTGEAKLVELSGESKNMTVILVSEGASTWFFKSMGSKAAVEREHAAFVEFVKSVQYN